MINEIQFTDPTIVVQNVEIQFPLYQFDLSTEIDFDKVLANISLLKEKYPTTTTTNVITNTGWRSPFIFEHEPDANLFSDEVNLITQKLHQVNSFKTKLINMWAVVYGSQDFSVSHNHYTLWSNLAYNTVLYLTDSTTPIVFETTGTSIEFFPKKGMLLAMHPLMYHSVPKVNDNSERVVLVCNFGM